jgi:hypothetical protein
MMHLGEVCALAGHLDDAMAFGARALALPHDRGQRGSAAWALRLFGETAARVDREQADDYFCQAMALATELGMSPIVAHCYLGLGQQHRWTR